MATPTYELISTNVLASATSSVTLGSITQDFQDLVVVAEIQASTTTELRVRLNSFTSDYAAQWMGATAVNTHTAFVANGDAWQPNGNITTSSKQIVIIDLLDYSSTAKHKGGLFAFGGFDTRIFLGSIRQPTTSAITSIQFSTVSGNFLAGSTFHIYGVAA